MSVIIVFTADQAALNQVKAALLACDSSGGLALSHYKDATSGLDALLAESALNTQIAAFIIDVTLPDGDGALLVDALREAGHTAPLVMLHDTQAYATQRLGEAASRKPVAMVAKTSPLPMLVAAIRRALSASDTVAATAQPAIKAIDTKSPETAIQAVQKLTTQADANVTPDDISWRVKRLSVREREVLALFCQGYAGKIVARKLGTELKTVFNQCSSIFEKTGVRPMRRLITLLAQAESRS